MTIVYNDKYLYPLINDERVDAATAFIDSMGTIPDPWRERLIMLQVYIDICVESVKAPDDIFSTKLKAYRAEFADSLNRARDAAERADDPQATLLPEYSLSATLDR